MCVNLPHSSSLHKDVKVQELSFKPTNLATSNDGLLRSNWGDLHSLSSVFSDFVFFFPHITFFHLLTFSLILKVVIFISVLFLLSRVCAFRSSLFICSSFLLLLTSPLVVSSFATLLSLLFFFMFFCPLSQHCRLITANNSPEC